MTKQSQFERIYKENYSKVMSLCLGYVKGDVCLAKDLTQDIFVKVWQHLAAFRQQAKISTWIYRIAVNTCLLELRQKKPLHLTIDAPAESSVDFGASEQRFTSMYRCIDLLSPENKSIILLELEGVPQTEIAEIIGISHAAIRTRIHRIKEQLSKCVTHG